MAIIDSSYFVADLSIPNIAGAQPIAVQNAATLNSLILIYEKDYLMRLLGSTLYDEFIADLATNEVWALALKAELADNTNKISPIACYVWYYWMRNQVSNVSNQGETESKNENSVNVSPGIRMTRAYNRMITLTLPVVEYINTETLPHTPETEYVWLTKINTFNI
jgi:hypothetical protein